MKVTIRPQRVSDAKRFFEILSSKNFKYFPVRVHSLEEEIIYLKGNAQRRRKNFAYNYAIMLGRQVVGGCGIKIDQHRPFIGEIGYFVHEKYWGQGIATQSVKLLERIGFAELDIIRMEIRMDARNKASIKVAKKCGYRREGFLKKAFMLSNKPRRYVDDLLYAKVK